MEKYEIILKTNTEILVRVNMADGDFKELMSDDGSSDSVIAIIDNYPGYFFSKIYGPVGEEMNEEEIILQFLPL